MASAVEKPDKLGKADKSVEPVKPTKERTKERMKERTKPRDGDSKDDSKDDSKVHKLSLKGSAKLVTEFFLYSIHSILYGLIHFTPSHANTTRIPREYSVETLTDDADTSPDSSLPSPLSPRFQRGVYPAEEFTVVKKYGLNMLVSADDEVKAYIKRIMGQLDKWMAKGKISKLVIVVTDKDTGENVERWQFDVQIFKSKSSKSQSTAAQPPNASGQPDRENLTHAAADPTADPAAADPAGKSEKEIQTEIAAIFRQITASVTFLPQLRGAYTFNVLVYADADSDVPVEWGDSDAKEIADAERVQLRGFSTAKHAVDTFVSYRLVD